MKQINASVFVCLFVAGISQAQAQLVHDSTSIFSYTGTVAVESSASKELYERAFAWCATRYKSIREMPKKKRNPQEALVANAWHDIYLSSDLGPYGVKMFYTLTIAVDDEKYNYKVSNIHYKTYADQLSGYTSDSFTAEMLFSREGYLNNGDIKPLNELYLEATNAYFSQLLNQLKLAMGKESILATR